MDFEEYIRSAPLDQIKQKINKFIKDDLEIQNDIGVQLLSRAQLSDDENDIKNIFELLATNFEPHPKITLNLLNLYDSMENKKILIETVPKVCGNTEVEMEQIFLEFKNWITEDRDSLIPIIGSIYEIPFNDSQKDKLNNIILESLAFIDESNIPLLVRTLLKNITKDNGLKIIQSIRKNCAELNDDELILISDILSTTFNINPITYQMFLKDLNQTKDLSKFDILIILILLQKRERKKIFDLFQKLFINGILTIDLLIETIENKYVCENVVNSIFSISIYMLHNFEVFKKEKKKYLSIVHLFYIEIFKNYEILRSKIISTLLSSLKQKDNFEICQCISSEILVSLTFDENQLKILSNFSTLFEDALQNSIHYPVNVIQSLVFILCKMSKNKQKLNQSLMIFLRKFIFSGQKNQTKIGIISLSNLIFENLILNEDFDKIFNWIETIFIRNEINENTLFLLELFDENIDRFTLNQMKTIFGFINELIENLKLIQQNDQIKTKIHFNKKEEYSFHLNISSLGSMSRTYYWKTLRMLIICLIKYESKLQNNLKFFKKYFRFGYSFSKNELNLVDIFELNCAFVINSALCNSFKIENSEELFKDFYYCLSRSVKFQHIIGTNQSKETYCIDNFKLKLTLLVHSFFEKELNNLFISQIEVENFILKNIFHLLISNFDLWMSEIKFLSTKYQKSSIIDPFDFSDESIFKSFPNLIFEIEMKSMIDLFINHSFFSILFEKLDSYVKENGESLIFATEIISHLILIVKEYDSNCKDKKFNEILNQMITSNDKEKIEILLKKLDLVFLKTKCSSASFSICYLQTTISYKTKFFSLMPKNFIALLKNIFVDNAYFASLLVQSRVWQYFFDKYELLKPNTFGRILISEAHTSTIIHVLLLSQIFFLTKEEMNTFIFDLTFALNDLSNLKEEKIINNRGFYENLRFRIINTISFKRIITSLLLIVCLRFKYLKLKKENFQDFEEFNLNLTFIFHLIKIIDNFISSTKLIFFKEIFTLINHIFGIIEVKMNNLLIIHENVDVYSMEFESRCNAIFTSVSKLNRLILSFCENLKLQQTNLVHRIEKSNRKGLIRLWSMISNFEIKINQWADTFKIKINENELKIDRELNEIDRDEIEYSFNTLGTITSQSKVGLIELISSDQFYNRHLEDDENDQQLMNDEYDEDDEDENVEDEEDLFIMGDLPTTEKKKKRVNTAVLLSKKRKLK
eukprot:gene1064-10583_t